MVKGVGGGGDGMGKEEKVALSNEKVENSAKL